MCLIDTDSDPDFADVPIPGNDDAMRSIEMILAHLADAVDEGLRGRQTAAEEEKDAEAPQRRSARPATARADEGAGAGPEDRAAKAPAADTLSAAPGAGSTK